MSDLAYRCTFHAPVCIRNHRFEIHFSLWNHGSEPYLKPFWMILRWQKEKLWWWVKRNDSLDGSRGTTIMMGQEGQQSWWVKRNDSHDGSRGTTIMLSQEERGPCLPPRLNLAWQKGKKNIFFRCSFCPRTQRRWVPTVVRIGLLVILNN